MQRGDDHQNGSKAHYLTHASLVEACKLYDKLYHFQENYLLLQEKPSNSEGLVIL